MKKFLSLGKGTVLLAGLVGITTVILNDSVCLAEPPLSTFDQISAASVSSPRRQPQTMAQLQQQLDMMQQTINQLQSTVATLKAQVSKSPAPPTAATTVPQQTSEDNSIGEELIFGGAAPATAATPLEEGASPLTTETPSVTQEASTNLSSGQLGGSFGRAVQNFNPDIVVSGDFTGMYANRSDIEGRNRFSPREAEFGFSSAIDPYARGTFIFSLPDSSPIELEEGYVSLLTLPWGLQANVGKFRSPFGKLNVVHGHDLPQTDRPDVLTQFLGEDGLIESGISVSKLLPTPWFSSVDVQLANGDTEPYFGHGRFTKPLLVGHLKNFFQLSDTKSFELGFSGAAGARGPEDLSRYSGIGGVDLTYKWLTPTLNHGLVWQTELLGAEQEHPFVGRGTAFGGYSYMEYKLAQRWNAGIRLDYTQIPLLADASTWAIAPYVDFWQSEFARARLEYKHTFGNNIQSSDQLWAQYSVILGLHPPHTF